jgi:hypothetical protein
MQHKLVLPQPIKAQHIKIIDTNAVYPHCRIAPTHAQPPEVTWQGIMPRPHQHCIKQADKMVQRHI